MKNKMMVTFTIAGMLFSSPIYAEKPEYFFGKEAEKIIVQGKIIHTNKDNFYVIYKKRLFQCWAQILDGRINCWALKE